MTLLTQEVSMPQSTAPAQNCNLADPGTASSAAPTVPGSEIDDLLFEMNAPSVYQVGRQGLGFYDDATIASQPLLDIDPNEFDWSVMNWGLGNANPEAWNTQLP